MQKAADETMEDGNAEKTHTEEGSVKEEAGRMYDGANYDEEEYL